MPNLTKKLVPIGSALDEANPEAIQLLADRGFSVVEIAALTNRNYRAVVKIAKAYGIEFALDDQVKAQSGETIRRLLDTANKFAHAAGDDDLISAAPHTAIAFNAASLRTLDKIFPKS
jgi:phosphoglycolate phosphatase-like HAD superfamily hydrolase